MHKIPSPKLSTKKLKPLRYLKYAVLLVMVVLLPLLAVNELGMGDPFLNSGVPPSNPAAAPPNGHSDLQKI